ncbi:AraC family transcriptional regulator [Bacteroides helcogenes]|uniref:Transcriptional regulator, AraC family n=1 Tax=Bacteroides helcogenes (strain ATCC 35417 / DSM 20613 / JCM 6297 / CCUG 15421 / P 36-108) TaxID=693979 RepID=E6SNG6_BACT6|nr:helix-turn-helix domain-containing protein [Bacteroides helcogenes]ADV42759.1 transcriptional regulator, AraC family [Bacteroides helcogenes P 36-108]MDY5239591.1 helix-turn-helix domain-containing protein [Bacteroides helcogenes]
MENRPTINIDFEDFKAYQNEIEYMDENVFFTEKRDLPILCNQDTRRITFLLIVACIDGCIQLAINGKQYQIQPHEALVCLPNMAINQVMFSPGTHICMIGFSSNFLGNVLKHEKGMDNMFLYLSKNPVHRNKCNEKPPLAQYYEQLIMGKIQEKDSYFKKDALKYLFSALLCEIISKIYEEANKEGEQTSTGIGRGNILCRQFMLELSKDNGRHRTVSYYANLLCYSPKYVSAVVKETSGRTAMDWINEYAIGQIKQRLKHSDKSVKEIADEFNFSNQSFFGKYVKAHLGMSPAQYRREPEK